MEFDTPNISILQNIPFFKVTWANIWIEIDGMGIKLFDSVPIIVFFLILITFAYLIKIVFQYLRKKEDNVDAEVKEESDKPEIELPERKSSPVKIDQEHEILDEEDFYQEIHYSFARSNQKQFEERCFSYLKRCPELVNNPKPPLMLTPFLRACWCGNTKLVEYMLKIGADVTAHTKDGDTAIYLAVYTAAKTPSVFDPSCLNALYKAGCDVNQPKIHGYTPLHLAAKFGNENLVCWLLAHGADPDCVTRSHMKPVDFANKHGHRKVVSLLTVKTGDGRHGVPKTKRRCSYSSISSSKN